MKGKGRKLAIVVLLVIILLAGGLYVGSGYLLGQALERKGFREAIGGKTAEFLDANAGYLPLASDGLSLSSPGFIAVASPPRVVMEMRASRLSTPCNLIELWRGRWRIENVSVQHLQAAIGSDGAQLIKRDEFPDPGLVAPLTTESPPKIDLQNIEIAQTDLFWSHAPNQMGEFRSVHASLFLHPDQIVVHGDGGTFRQAQWPVTNVEQLKLLYIKPELRVDEALLTFAGVGMISVLGNFRFEQPVSFDLELTFAHCPVAPFLSDAQRTNFEAELDGTAHVQKAAGQNESVHAAGSIAITKAIFKNVETLRRIATFTGREELARFPIDQVKADYEWNWPILSVKNLVLESNRILIVKGEFVMKEDKLDGEFQLGVIPDLVEKFPGARAEIFTRNDGGYLWTKLTLSGTVDQPRIDLKPRLVRAAQNRLAKGTADSTLTPDQTVIEAIEGL